MRLGTGNPNGNICVFHSCLSYGCITIVRNFYILEYVMFCREGAC